MKKMKAVGQRVWPEVPLVYLLTELSAWILFDHKKCKKVMDA
jgi:hypothetical protein